VPDSGEGRRGEKLRLGYGCDTMLERKMGYLD
jgi:hypothetical protein